MSQTNNKPSSSGKCASHYNRYGQEVGGSDGIFCVRYCQINFLVHGLSILEQVEKQFNLTLDHHSVVTPKVKMTQTSPEMKNLFQGSKHHSNPDNHLCNTIGNVDVSKKYYSFVLLLLLSIGFMVIWVGWEAPFSSERTNCASRRLLWL